MAGERPILIVDDDGPCAQTLAEQLASTASSRPSRPARVGGGGRAALAAQGRPLRRDDPRRRPARRRRPRLLRQAAAPGPEDADHHADRLGRRDRRGARPRFRRQRLHRQAVPAGRTAGPAARPAAHLREQRGRGVHHRPLHVPPGGEAAAGAGAQPPHPADRERGGDPEIPVSRRHASRWRGRCC